MDIAEKYLSQIIKDNILKDKSKNIVNNFKKFENVEPKYNLSRTKINNKKFNNLKLKLPSSKMQIKPQTGWKYKFNKTKEFKMKSNF